jgi:hypothetical protein
MADFQHIQATKASFVFPEQLSIKEGDLILIGL